MLKLENAIALLNIPFYYYSMKNTIIALASILLLASCSKKSSDTNEPAASVQSVTWTNVYIGSNPSIKFIVDFVIIRSVTKVNLIKANDVKVVSEVKNPVTGTYTMYHHGQYVPNYMMHEMYYFEFMMADGSKIVTEPFQVY